SSDRCKRVDEQGGQGRNRRHGKQQVSPGEGATIAAPRLGARRWLRARPVHWAAAMGAGRAERSAAVTLIYSWSNDSAGLEFGESAALRRLTTAACSSCSSNSARRSTWSARSPEQNATILALVAPNSPRCSSLSSGGPMNDTITLPEGAFRIDSKKSPGGTSRGRNGST